MQWLCSNQRQCRKKIHAPVGTSHTCCYKLQTNSFRYKKVCKPRFACEEIFGRKSFPLLQSIERFSLNNMHLRSLDFNPTEPFTILDNASKSDVLELLIRYVDRRIRYVRKRGCFMSLPPATDDLLLMVLATGDLKTWRWLLPPPPPSGGSSVSVATSPPPPPSTEMMVGLMESCPAVDSPPPPPPPPLVVVAVPSASLLSVELLPLAVPPPPPDGIFGCMDLLMRRRRINSHHEIFWNKKKKPHTMIFLGIVFVSILIFSLWIFVFFYYFLAESRCFPLN